MESYELIIDLIIKVEKMKKDEQQKTHSDNLDSIVSQSKQLAYSDILIYLYKVKEDLQNDI